MYPQPGPGPGASTLAALHRRCGDRPGTFRRRLRASRQGDLPLDGGPCLDPASVSEAERGNVLKAMTELGIHPLTPGDEAWPGALSSIEDPPLLLYRRGLPLPEGPALAVAGSRTEEAYARRITRAIVARWASLFPGSALISGGGLGVDAAALRAALDLGLHPVTVLASGVDRPSPRSLARLFDAATSGGTLLSEALPGSPPWPGCFPDRNRLIPALAEVTVVVRAAPSSGSLHTLRHAARQGRTVLAVVGPIDDPRSAGNHGAIRSGLARPLFHLDDLDRVCHKARPRPNASSEKPAPLRPGSAGDGNGRRVLAILRKGSTSVDEVSSELGLTVSETMQIMLALELEGRVRRLPAHVYEGC